MRYRKHHVGRTRIKLAALLNKCFPEWDVRPEHLEPASGSYRTNRLLDVYCWELFTYTKTGLPVVLGCFDTMTECLKAGSVVLSHDELMANHNPKEKQDDRTRN